MFEKLKECLNEFENAFHQCESGRIDKRTEDIVVNFNLNLAKALIQEEYVDSTKVAKIIIAAAGLSNEVIVKIK